MCEGGCNFFLCWVGKGGAPAVPLNGLEALAGNSAAEFCATATVCIFDTRHRHYSRGVAGGCAQVSRRRAGQICTVCFLSYILFWFLVRRNSMEEGRFSSVSLQFPRWPIRGGCLGKIAPFLSVCVYVFLGEESKRSVDPRDASPVLFLSLSATSLSFASPLALALALLLGGIT